MILYGTDEAFVCRSVMVVLILPDSMPCGMQLIAATLSMGCNAISVLPVKHFGMSVRGAVIDRAGDLADQLTDILQGRKSHTLLLLPSLWKFSN